MKSVQTNPFVIGAYAGSHYFCDRERETDELIQDLMNGRSIDCPAAYGKDRINTAYFSSGKNQ